jgi:hypothetical protein
MCLRIQFFIHLCVSTFNFLKKGHNCLSCYCSGPLIPYIGTSILRGFVIVIFIWTSAIFRGQNRIWNDLKIMPDPQYCFQGPFKGLNLIWEEGLAYSRRQRLADLELVNFLTSF